GDGGGWLFTLNSSLPATQALALGQTKDFTLKYTLTDNDGDTSTAELTIHIKGTNDAPIITFGNDGADANAAVSEEGLPGTGNLDAGIPLEGNDVDGVTDTTNATTATGQFQVSDLDAGDTLEVKLGDGTTGQGVSAARANDGVG